MAEERKHMPDYCSMSGPELLAAVRDDARKWAEAFQQIVVSHGVEIDEALMIGWFANAIENSSDIRSRAAIKRATEG